MFKEMQECIDLGLRSGAIYVEGIKIHESPIHLRKKIHDLYIDLKERYSEPALIKNASEIEALHSIYREIGISPRKTQPACQRLITLLIKRGDLPSINNLVDAYNLVSAQSLCCLGAHDAETLAFPVCLKLLNGHETFTPLGASEPHEVVKGQFAYVDAEDRVICLLDILQADFSKVTSATKNVLLIIEGTTVITPDRLLGVFNDLIAKVKEYCGGEAKIVYFPY